MGTSESSIAPANEGLPVRWLVPQAGEMLSLTEQIASKIGNRIIAGEIEPGAHITEQQLADEFRVSRGPIREAFRILEREHLVVYSARRGITVPKLGAEDFDEIYEIASALYQVVARRLASMQSTEAIRILDDAITAAGSSLTMPEGADVFTRVGISVANELAGLAGNGRLKRILATLIQESYRFRSTQFQSEAHRKKVLGGWRQLRNAINKGNPEAAAHSYANIIEFNRQRLNEMLAEAHGAANGAQG